MKHIKQIPIYLYEEDKKIIEKLELEKVNVNRLIRSLLNDWYYKEATK